MNFKILKQEEKKEEITKSMEIKNNIKRTINMSTTP